MTTSHGRAYGSSRPAKIALGLAGWLLAGQLSASASPITSALNAANPLTNLVKSTLDPASRQMSEFESFLAGGPKRWATSRLMKVPQGVTVTRADGTLKTNKTVDYLMWVRDQHPDTFDLRHPNLGPKLALAQAQRVAGTQYTAYLPTPSPSTPAGVTSPSTPAGATPTPTSTPTGVASQSSQTPQAQVLQPPAPAQTSPTPQAQTLPFPVTALGLLASPSIPSVSDLPTPGSSPTARVSPEVMTSPIVTTNPSTAGQSSLGGDPTATATVSAAPIPEPSTVALTVLLFGSAACWSRWRARG